MKSPLSSLMLFTLILFPLFSLSAQTEQRLYAGAGSNVHEIGMDGTSRVYATISGTCTGMDVDEDGTLWVCSATTLFRIPRHDSAEPATLENGGVEAFTDGFLRIRGMAIDPEGNFWMAERGRGDRSLGVRKVDRETKEQIIIKERDESARGNIYSVERGPDGLMYVSVQGGQTIIRFHPDGTPVKGTVENPEPFLTGFGGGHRSIAFGPDGSFYHIHSDGIMRFDAEGNQRGLIFDWTYEGFKSGELGRDDFIARGARHPMDLAVSQDGVVFGSDAGYDKKPGEEVGGGVYRYHADGTRTLVLEAGSRVNWMAFWPRTEVGK